MVSFTVQLITDGHRSIVCSVIFKIMIVIQIIYKQIMLISDVIMENPFVNSAGVGVSNGEIVRFTSSKSIQCNTM